MEAREAELLPVEYFHVVFTLPSALGPIALQDGNWNAGRQLGREVFSSQFPSFRPNTRCVPFSFPVLGVPREVLGVVERGPVPEEVVAEGGDEVQQVASACLPSSAPLMTFSVEKLLIG